MAIGGDQQRYLKKNRLADIIRAIQYLGTYTEWSGLTLEALSDDQNRHLGKAASGDWFTIFEEHPEFFVIRKNSASPMVVGLVWRRAQPLAYDPASGKALTRDEARELRAKMKDDQKFWDTITHKPLATHQIGTLMSTAIRLHSQALASAKDGRWWIDVIKIAFALLGVVIGGLLGSEAHHHCPESPALCSPVVNLKAP
jgi:hypothetical protein